MESGSEVNPNVLSLNVPSVTGPSPGGSGDHSDSVITKKLLMSWDPLNSQDWDRISYPADTLFRIQRDLQKVLTDPVPGVCVLPVEEDIATMHVLISGPFETPYEGGFFHFVIRCPPTYPFQPPRVRLLTTGDGTVRFNPNLYSSGKVCLSLLGTWHGPCWSPALSISSLVISIQSLMNSKPYHNEPGFETERKRGDVEAYNRIIEHETLRVAVLGHLEEDSRSSLRHHSQLAEVVRTSFVEFFDHYIETCDNNMKLDGQKMVNPLGQLAEGQFQFRDLKQRLEAIHTRFSALN